MSFGFPGANTSFENHDVSEESFWPSFTDIMMVIVMVFLLVAVSVILNNYQLVENLKQSMQAQQLASEMAEDTQLENSSLEDRLLRLKQQLALANRQIVNANTEAGRNETALSKSQKIIKELNAISIQKDQQLDKKTAYLAALEDKSKQQLEQKNTEISDLKKQQQTHENALTLATETASIQQQQTTSLEATVDILKNSLNEQTTQFATLKQQRQHDETQLLSLQGELESLDKKYQKLLRPARSAKNKYVVAVTYIKRKGRGVYRLRAKPTGNYKRVSRKQLERQLEVLKDKHSTNLYIKVIIPKNSGLSYNEAWKFTSFVQKAYDYYFQGDKGSHSTGE